MQNLDSINKDDSIIDTEEPIMLYLGSMLDETPSKIKEEVATFNEMVDDCIKHGQQYKYITSDENTPMSYDELMMLETVSNYAKSEIKARGAETNVEKARVIEHVVSHFLKDIVHFNDDDFYTAGHTNLAHVLNTGRASCCHFAALTNYLHLRNNMYSDLIYSRVNVESEVPEGICHIFNLLFLDDDKNNWTFVDTMWEKEFLKIRERTRFSFMSVEDIQNDPFDTEEAHKYIETDLSNLSIISINMQSIDKKLGYQHRCCLFQCVYFLAYHIKHGNMDSVKSIFDLRDPNVTNLLNKNPMIQSLGLIAYTSALELGNTGLIAGSKRPDETARIECLDTYLKEVLPTLYITFYEDRIKQTNPSALDDYNSTTQYLTSLFEIIKTKDGNVGIHFDDTIDKAYLGIGFDEENSLPFVEVLNSIQFGEIFGTITKDKPTPDREIAD